MGVLTVERIGGPLCLFRVMNGLERSLKTILGRAILPATGFQLLKNTGDRLLPRTAQNRAHAFAITYRAATKGAVPQRHFSASCEKCCPAT